MEIFSFQKKTFSKTFLVAFSLLKVLKFSGKLNQMLGRKPDFKKADYPVQSWY